MAQSRARCAAAVVSFAAAAAAAAAGGGVTTATAYVGANGTCTVVPGSFPSNGTAWGRYEDGAAASAQGWGRLEIFTPAAGAADSIAMAYAAGCVEAFLTSHHIGQMAANARANLFPGGLPAVAALFLDVQQGYVRLAVAANYNHSAAAPPQDPFWAASAHLLAQFDGLAAACVRRCGRMHSRVCIRKCRACPAPCAAATTSERIQIAMRAGSPHTRRPGTRT